MRVVHLPILLVLAGSAAVAAPSDQKEFLDIATRFARTTTNDPAYNGVLAAYCQRVRARIEGLPGNDDHRVVDRGAFGPSAFALGGTCARVGHGYFWEPRVLFPPRGAMVYAILLHPAYDVAAPGEYEIWAHYWGGLVDPSNDPDMFRGQIPATPVPFRVLPSWRAMLTVCAAVALPAAGLLALGWRALRRRARAA